MVIVAVSSVAEAMRRVFNFRRPAFMDRRAATFAMLLGAWLRRRYCRLERPNFANVMSRVVRLLLSLLGVTGH